MIIIADRSIPGVTLSNLKKYGEVLAFDTKGITYPAISGHPDVFFCITNNLLIIAPNTPAKFKRLLTNNKLSYVEGHGNVGNSYPETAKYNAVVTENFLIHNLKITDKAIKEACDDKISIHVSQAYTRCNLVSLRDNSFITSDKGIYEALSSAKLNVLYVNPQETLLPGFKHGFFGGTCGVYHNQIFIIGSLNKFHDGKKVEAFLKKLDYQIIELNSGQLFDGGSLIFID